MEIDYVTTKLPIKDLQKNMSKKIALLFRGPLRPDPYSVAIHTNLLKNELISYGFQVTTYLATWMTYKEHNANELLSMGFYDNVIVQQSPSREQVERCTKRESYGIYPIANVFGMYYQSKIAIDLISSADDYDYIVHSRTDLRVKFGKHIQDWFDPTQYVSPTNQTPWICDWIGIATPEIMQKSWDYINYHELGRLIDNSEVPEYILMNIMKNNNIDIKTCDTEEIWLDPKRVG